jgi:hypothetical protein
MEDRLIFKEFTNLYSTSKTLRFNLVPEGDTLKNIEKNGILKQDEQLAVDFKKAKKIADNWLKDFLNKSLEGATLNADNLTSFEESYNTFPRTDEEQKRFEELQKTLRKEITSCFQKNPKYKLLGSADLIKKELPEFAKTDEEKELIKKFKDFTTYFTGYHTTRENIYGDEEKHAAFAYRIVHENLPIFLQNKKKFETIKNTRPELVDEIHKSVTAYLPDVNVEDMFSLAYFSKTLTQAGIDAYNQMIGGVSAENGKKIEKFQGFNEKVNLFRQANKADGKTIPSLKQLRKQILGDKNIPSWVTEGFADAREMQNSINDEYNSNILPLLPDIANFFSNKNYDYTKIFVRNDRFITDFSHENFKDFNIVKNVLLQRYIADNPKIKNPESSFSKIQYISVADIQNALPSLDPDFVFKYLYGKSAEIVMEIKNAYIAWNLRKTETATTKRLMDALLSLQRLFKPLNAENIQDKDIVFYETFDKYFESMSGIVKLYNEVRNFMTKKPYSVEKIKLNFENSNLLGGWDADKEESNGGVLLQKDGDYFLGIINKKHKIFRGVPEATAGEESYKKMEYNLLPNAFMMLPKVFFSDKGMSIYEPDDEILKIYNDKTFKSGDNFSIDDMRSLIDFYKDSIKKNGKWNSYGFNFRPTDEYNKINEFYDDVDRRGYKITFKDIAADYINELVRDGKLYLFKIYNKDFSAKSKGTPNLHTLYWKALFDEQNLKNLVYKLNGGAELFFRKKSIEYTEEILEKGHHYKELKDKFDYPIIKDRRFAFDKFQFNVPLTLNAKAPDKAYVNDVARNFIRSNPDIKIIGINRGERHLIYISVIDVAGNIIEQRSLNLISNDYNDKTFTTDYRGKLDVREKERAESRENWGVIGNIKDLKEGYLSQVVHQVVSLILKHKAVIVMEDLNVSFLRERFAIEKQVYQKFEKMLIDKLNYFVDKKKNHEETGGLLNALQLTNKFISFERIGKQNGLLFYVSPWKVTDIDPTTGFVSLFDTRYLNIEKAREFFGKFKAIRYNSAKDMFEFEFNYKDFNSEKKSARDKWTVCTDGERMEIVGNGSGKSSARAIDLTKEYKALLSEYLINYKNVPLKEAISTINEKDFFVKLLHLFRLTVQMRNFDYIISPVINASGGFFDSRKGVMTGLPENSAANGAYNIARKGLMNIERIMSASDIKKVDLKISPEEWMQYAQNGRGQA